MIKTMKKYVFSVAFLMVTAIHAQQVQKNQQNNVDILELVDRSNSYGISLEQKERLIARKRTIGREYAAINRDRSLSGYERSIKKRELSQKIQSDIRAILNEDQYGKWEKHYSNYDANSATKEALELQIDRLEKEYEQDIKQIEQRYRNDKYTLKHEKNKRKSHYKSERQKLKDQRDLL